MLGCSAQWLEFKLSSRKLEGRPPLSVHILHVIYFSAFEYQTASDISTHTPPPPRQLGRYFNMTQSCQVWRVKCVDGSLAYKKSKILADMPHAIHVDVYPCINFFEWPINVKKFPFLFLRGGPFVFVWGFFVMCTIHFTWIVHPPLSLYI